MLPVPLLKLKILDTEQTELFRQDFHFLIWHGEQDFSILLHDAHRNFVCLVICFQ